MNHEKLLHLDRFLWPEMCRVIGEFKPTWVIAENVRGLLTQGGGVVFERVCTDLEGLGYEVWPIVIPAVAVGAPHRRDRVWFIGHAEHNGRDGSEDRQGSYTGSDDNEEGTDKSGKSARPNSSRSAITDAHSVSRKLERVKQDEAERQCRQPDRAWRDKRPDWSQHWLEVATRLCRMDDGLPRRLDRNPRLKALGNAIVPQVAEEIMRAIPL